jgi:hypothetical protein
MLALEESWTGHRRIRFVSHYQSPSISNRALAIGSLILAGLHELTAVFK